MLVETKNLKQTEGQSRRRWFSDDYFDLIVWQDEKGGILRFELCYDKGVDEHVLVWNRQAGHKHLKVDDGEGLPGHYKMTPVYVSDGLFDR